VGNIYAEYTSLQKYSIQKGRVVPQIYNKPFLEEKVLLAEHQGDLQMKAEF
jgi:hypothetical protein